MKILYSYLRQYWTLVAFALFLAAVNIVFSLLDPAIYQRVIDNYATNPNNNESQFFSGVIQLLGLAVGVAFVSRVAKNFQDYYVNVVTLRIGAQMYSEGLAHSLKLPYSVFEDQVSGETLGKLQKVRDDVQKIIVLGVNTIFTTIVGVIFVTIYAARVNWLVAPVYFSAIPIITFLSLTFSKKIKKVQKTIVGQTTALAGSTTESLRNIELVKSLGLAKQEISRLYDVTKKILGLELKKVRYVRSLSFIQGTVVNLLRTTIAFMMLYLIFKHEITTGQYFALFVYSFFIFSPLQDLGTFINTFRETEVSLLNFTNIMNALPEPRPESPQAVSTLEKLDFTDVTFQHQSASFPALQSVTFTAKRGETIAFAGPSGSGKTTLVKLLVGLYHPKQGNISYNDIPADEIDLDDLRNKIGFVTQDAQLFSGSIKENLLFVRPDATDEECMKVLHQAACESLLARASNGLDTVIGEGGVKVSGGEKQRLSIARALLRKPQLLVFDEATSSLDSITEEEISKTIRDVSTRDDQITILIAHRLSTIMHADRIYVLERGHVIESGKHQDLLAEKGLYYAMWRQQIGERGKNEAPKIALAAVGNMVQN